MAGAEKVSVNSLAVQNPKIIAEGAREFGAQCIVLGMDPVKVDDCKKFPSGYEITIRGFRERTGLDALEWAKRAEGLGAGEIVVNSVDADGTRKGFEINLDKADFDQCRNSGCCKRRGGCARHLVEVFRDGMADAAIVASMITHGQIHDQADQG